MQALLRGLGKGPSSALLSLRRGPEREGERRDRWQVTGSKAEICRG